MAHIGECLGCLASLSKVHNQLHGQVTRQCYIHARKSKVGKPWTMKMTDSSGDALYNKVQNQQWPCRNTELVDINPASFFHHSDPRTRGTQRLHQEQAQHHILFHSLFPPTVSETEWNLLPMPLFGPCSQVIPLFQSRLGRSLHNRLPVPTSRWISRKSCPYSFNCRLPFLFIIVYYCL